MVQEIRHKKRELGAFTNQLIKTNVLTSKIKCKYCNISFQRASRKLVNGRSRYSIYATRKADHAIFAEQEICTKNN